MIPLAAAFSNIEYHQPNTMQFAQANLQLKPPSHGS